MFNYISWVAVIVASLITFVIGGPWYSPMLFGKRWNEAMKHSPTDRGHPARVFGLAFVFSFIGAAALAMLLPVDATFSDGIKLGAVVGACFVATSFGVNYQFSNRPWIALLIDGGFHIVQFSLMGAILGAWHS
jgi:Protein of unknown function (DUF1761)